MQRSFAAAGCLLLSLAGPAAGQTPTISFPDAVRRALLVQPAVVQAEGTQRTASAAQRTAWGSFLPTISVGGAVVDKSANQFNSGTGQIIPGQEGTTFSGTLGLTLDLFAGFRRTATLNASSATVRAAEAGLVNERYQVTATTAQLYYTALADEDLVRVAQAQVDRSQLSLQISLNRFQAGAATRSDTLSAKVDYGNSQLSLLQAQATLATAQANLGRQVGFDTPVRALPDSVLPILPDTGHLRQEAMDSSPQVRQALAQARAAESQIAVARSQYWPTFSAGYSNGYVGAGGDVFSPNVPYVGNWSFRLSLNWTLFNGLSREQEMVSASVQRDIALSDAQDMRRQLNAQFTQQLAALFTGYTQIEISGTNVAAATEGLRVQQERYRVGAATQLDVLTAETNLTQAEVNQVQARYNYLVARAQLEALVGHAL
ncbi:MAG TPA: TolC family protein [Gemmatimonadales bacterium]|nr:TolC family protein [Gemmatimonadales bacterium]